MVSCAGAAYDRGLTTCSASCQPVLSAVSEAARYGLYDLDRLERMVLRRIARDYFLLESKGTPDEDQ